MQQLLRVVEEFPMSKPMHLQNLEIVRMGLPCLNDVNNTVFSGATSEAVLGAVG